jgi:hypothetical protein
VEADLHDDVHGAEDLRTATTAHERQRKRIDQLGDKEGSECDPDQASCSREGCGERNVGWNWSRW